MRTKSTEAETNEDANYRALIGEQLREIKQLQKQILRDRAETNRLRASFQRKQKVTREILRRVEANL